jgi:hypothetical protein
MRKGDYPLRSLGRGAGATQALFLPEAREHIGSTDACGATW